MAQLNQRTNAVGISIENIVIHVKNAPSFGGRMLTAFALEALSTPGIDEIKRLYEIALSFKTITREQFYRRF